MHTIEPFYKWSEIYDSAEDSKSPFYKRQYNNYEFVNTVYNYYIHPLWDEFGSNTLYLKLLFVDYKEKFAIIEFIGEWNDCLYNDIMFLKRDVIDLLIKNGIKKYILIGENVYNFHYSDDSYYQEWADDIDDGWVLALNFRIHTYQEFKSGGIMNYIIFNNPHEQVNWRKLTPQNLFLNIDNSIPKKLY